MLDGRNCVVEGYENGFYVGPTIFDHVTEDMTIGRDEVFGPVLCIKRVKSFEEGLAVMNANPDSSRSQVIRIRSSAISTASARTHIASSQRASA